jgi:hypothetical protein
MHAAPGVALCAGVQYGGVVRHDGPPSTPESNPDQADCLAVGAEQQWQLPTTPAHRVYQSCRTKHTACNLCDCTMMLQHVCPTHLHDVAASANSMSEPSSSSANSNQYPAHNTNMYTRHQAAHASTSSNTKLSQPTHTSHNFAPSPPGITHTSHNFPQSPPGMCMSTTVRAWCTPGAVCTQQ